MQRLESTHSSSAHRTVLTRALGWVGKGLWPAALAMLLTTVGAHGQAKRCDLVSKDTVVAGKSIKRCLDLDALDGTTITVPSNITRIDNDGLSLCRSNSSIGGNADVVFVLDQSNSMLADFIWISSDKKDTVYFEGRNSSNSCDPTGTVNFPIPGTNPVQTLSAKKLPTKACGTGIAGDPFQRREAAVEGALDYMASISSGSTAGYTGFNATLVGPVPLLPLNVPANIARLKDSIQIKHAQNTNYTLPLTQSINWLNDPALKKTDKQAIIFISDGQPYLGGTNADKLRALAYLDTIAKYKGLNQMPKVYTIYLGANDDVDGYTRLSELADSTGGIFYKIPPTRPDSLNSVVKNILNLILKEYNPDVTTVTNLDLSQSASASMPTGFVSQGTGTWLVKLNDIIALRSGSNAIRVATDFKEASDNSIKNKTINFTISATGTPATGSTTINTTTFAQVCYDASTLRILNGAGVRPATLTELDTTYQLRLHTAPSFLSTMSAYDSAQSRKDAESPSLLRLSVPSDSTTFQATANFRISSSGSKGDGTLQSAQFDTVIARWVHPRDPKDVAFDTLTVRAAQKQAKAYFTATAGGTVITNYPATSTTVYVTIEDQTRDKRKSYTAVITSENVLVDREVVSLTELPDGSGKFVGQLTVNLGAKNAGDNMLQVNSVGDQLRVVYVDPVDGDTAVGKAGFSQSVQEAADLQFADASGNALAAGAVWSPSQGKLFVTYSDDYNATIKGDGDLEAKTVSLVLTSKKYGATLGSDREPVTLDIDLKPSLTRGIWNGSINLLDAFPASDSNSKAETRYRGEATVTVQSHDNEGNAEAATLSDLLVIAYPDSQATLHWKLADSAAVPAGTEGLILTVNDQNFTNGANDSVNVTVTCAKSGDSVSNVSARESSSGTYVTSPVVKNEGVPNLSDRVLSCLSADQILVSYTDPVYGTTATLTVDEVAKPVADPKGLSFTVYQDVDLSTATPGATIYYTLNGATPTSGNGTIFSGPIHLIGNTVLKAIAVRPGWKDSKVMVETYTKTRSASRLELLDANGNDVSGGTLTGAATELRVKVTTAQAGLAGIQPGLITRGADDAENLFMANPTFLGGAYEYQENIAFHHGVVGDPGNDTLEAIGTDTLIAEWTNPLDSTDVARDTLFIKPAFVAADVYFSLTEGGARITEYPLNQDTVFIVVKSRPRDATLTYTVTLTSSQTPGTDTEVLTLTELSPGVYSAKVPVSTGTKTAGNHSIEVAAAGDQLTAVFVDPVYGDSYQGNAGFAQQVQENASLDFIDQDGNLLTPDRIWSPSAGHVYLRYSDDWSAGIDGMVHTVSVNLSLVNKKAGVTLGTDEEVVVLTLDTNVATRGTWLGSLPLKDSSTVHSGNNSLETYYRGELTASIVPHNNAGTQIGAEVSDQLVIAYPNQPADITILDTAGTAVDRKTRRVDITIHDQLFSQSGTAGISAEVSCNESGDKVSNVLFVWDGSKYVLKDPFNKGEITSGSVDQSDALLLCRDSDILTVRYTDPVFSDVKTADVRWQDNTVSRMYYASSKDNSEIKSVSDAVDKDFLVMVEGKSPTRDKADTILVTLTTAQGEKETVRAVETGALTGKFVVKTPFQFRSSAPVQENKKVEGHITIADRVNQVLMNGTATIGGETVHADLYLFSTYDLIAGAYIKDLDENGRADHVYILFDHKLSNLPSALDSVYWNKVAGPFSRKADAAHLSFQPGSDSTIVVADFTASQFGEFLTDIPSGQAPYALLPDDNLFGGQKAPLADSVGPVGVTAFKKPSDLLTYAYSGTERRFNPDTLVMTVSEKIKTTSSTFNNMLRYSKGCADYSQAVPIKTFSEPSVTSDGLTWTIILDNTPGAPAPLVDDCIFLEVDGRYVDLQGNRPGRLAVPLTGNNPRLTIRSFQGFPPVAGVDAGSPASTIINHSTAEGDAGAWKEIAGRGTRDAVWIPPVGFNGNDPVNSLQHIADQFSGSQSQTSNPELTGFQPMPDSISAVLVIATGAYKAQIHIFDNLGHFVRYMEQAYGMNGEDKNPFRSFGAKGQASFLVWDLRDKNRAKVGQGVYIWKVNFTFLEKNKKSEVMFTRTGVMRN